MVIKILEHGSPAYEEMIRLRYEVLLQPIHVPLSFIKPEKEKNDILIGAYAQEKLIGCCVLTKIDAHTIQLRQMAVATSYQGKGIGAAIVAYSEKVAQQENFATIMMHARDAVLNFYERCGYSIAGPQFFEVGIPHHKMQKQL